jgi:DNA transformation protein
MSQSQTKLLNIGKVSQQWLNNIGIYTTEDLREVGVAQAYIKIRLREPKASLNLLYGLWGALENVKWTEIPQSIKDELKRAVE